MGGNNKVFLKKIFLCEYCNNAQYDMFGEKVVDCKIYNESPYQYCIDVKKALIEEHPQLKDAEFYN